MRDMTCACAAGYLEGTPLLDMNYVEDAGGGPDVSVALQPLLDKLVLVQVGRVPFSFQEIGFGHRKQ